MNISILHLSDLHRDLANPIANRVLIDSWVRDQQRYVTEGVRHPDPIIVSGDVIHGIRPDTPHPDRSLSEQYNEALLFLNDLTIVTKNWIYVPVPKPLETFQITEGAKEFFVRFDTIP